MKLTRIIPLALMAFAVLSSCSEEATSKTYFDFYSQELPFSGGTVTFTVYSNGDWTVVSQSDDMTISPESGYGDTKITVTVPANDQITTKSFNFSAKTTIGTSVYTNKAVVTVDAQPFVLCEGESLEVPAEGGKAWFTANSNYAWKVADISASDGSAEGVNVNPSEKERNIVSVEVYVPANTSGVAREVTVTLALNEYPDRTATLKVCQPA